MRPTDRRPVLVVLHQEHSTPGRVGLRLHPESTAEQIEVVDVGRTEIGLQRGEDVRHLQAEQLHLGAVDVEIKLRRRRFKE